MIRNFIVFCATIAVSSAAGHAASFSPVTPGPLGFDSGSQIRSNSYDGATASQDFYNIVSDQGGTYAGQTGQAAVAAKAIQSSGEVGVSVTTTQSVLGAYTTGSSQARLFDLLTFGSAAQVGSGPVSVSYSVSYDGTITNRGDAFNRDTIAVGSASVRIFDVTGLPHAFEVFGSAGSLGNLVAANAQGYFDPNIGMYGQFVFTNRVSATSGGLALISPSLQSDVADGSYAIGAADSYMVNTSGVPQAFSGTLTDTFMATPGHLYAIEISAEAWTSGYAASSGVDMMNTATFGFTDTSGLAVFSSSGSLPGTSAFSGSTPVPLPAPVLGLMSACGMLALFSRRGRGAARA